jgi:hypothetical protein
VALLGLILLAPPDSRAWAQSLTIALDGGALRVEVIALRFIQGEPLQRLKNGRSVRFDFDLEILERARGRVLARARHSFDMGYDLWEERFAIVRVGSPPRSTSYLTQGDAERWCLEELTVPADALRAVDRNTPFWVRLTYRVVDDEPREGDDDESFTLQRLIDRLSRRQAARALEDSVEAGPFRLPGT